MRHFFAFLFRLLPLRMLLSTLLFITLFFTSALPAMAAKSSPDKGVVQLDEITKKTEEATKLPPESINPIDEAAEAGPNEIQGTADRDKMIRSNDTELPMIKEIKKALDK